MARWRAKLVSLLVVYSSGFLTAIYFMAPGPEPSTSKTFELPTGVTVDREEIFRRINSGLHDCVALGKDAAGRIVVTLREQMNQTTTTSSDEES